EAVLQRIGAVNATLNAYITVCAPQAREVAQATERMIRAGYYLGPLHGIPVALKDNIYTRGVRTTAGAKILADFVPDEDATVAAGTGLGARGTATGGSISLRSPVNGIVGIRPTIGRVSNHNVVPLAWTMDTVSPMTRTVEDCVTMFEVIAGYDPLDPHSAEAPLADYRAGLGRGVRGLRIGLIRDYSLTHLQKAVGDAVRGALKT